MFIFFFFENSFNWRTKKKKNTNHIDFGVPLHSYFTSQQSDDAFKKCNCFGNNNIS